MGQNEKELQQLLERSKAMPKINKLTPEQRKGLLGALFNMAKERNPHLFKEPTAEQKEMMEKMKMMRT